MYSVRERPTRQISPLLQTEQQSALTDPDTRAVTGAFVSEALSGIGTLSADFAAMDVKEAERGTPLTKEQYQQSPNYRPNIAYYRGITEESAKALASFNDSTEKRAEFINEATGGQKALGYTAAFTAGLFEPKNLGTGIATTAVLSPLAAAIAPAASGFRRLMALKKVAGRYGDKAMIGGVEGLVSAAIAEPSNQYSAKVLQQDYTMADTMWNIGLSTALGVGLTTVPPLIKDKWGTHKAKTPDVVGAELDLATEQLIRGQRVDVGMIERGTEVSKKPIAEKAAAVESFVRYTETPEFKAKFEGSKVVDENGAPLRVYHGTKAEFGRFEINRASERSVKSLGEGFFFSPNAGMAASYAQGRVPSNVIAEGANIRPAYLNVKNPLVIRENTLPENVSPAKFLNAKYNKGPRYLAGSDELTKSMIADGYDAIMVMGDDGKIKEIGVFSPDQIISAFGADDMDTIAARMDSENKAYVGKAVKDSADPLNDTAVDMEAAKQTEQFEENLTDDEAQALAEFETYQEQINADEGLKNDLAEALDNLNEADIEEAYKNLYACLTRG